MWKPSGCTWSSFICFNQQLDNPANSDETKSLNIHLQLEFILRNINGRWISASSGYSSNFNPWLLFYFILSYFILFFSFSTPKKDVNKLSRFEILLTLGGRWKTMIYFPVMHLFLRYSPPVSTPMVECCTYHPTGINPSAFQCLPSSNSHGCGGPKPIYYSLSNFIFSRVNWRVGGGGWFSNVDQCRRLTNGFQSNGQLDSIIGSAAMQSSWALSLLFPLLFSNGKISFIQHLDVRDLHLPQLRRLAPQKRPKRAKKELWSCFSSSSSSRSPHPFIILLSLFF